MTAVSDRAQQEPLPEVIPQSFPELYSRFTDEEMSRIVQLKRFFENVNGDAEFRAAVESGQITDEQIQRLRDTGVTFEMDDVALLWKGSHKHFEPFLLGASPDELPDGFLEDLKQYPLLYLWGRFVYLKSRMYTDHYESVRDMACSSSPFVSWRNRRIAATKSELGAYGHGIDHPAVAIELAVGCSVGCYFCAFDAPKLEKVFDYTVPENRELFRGIARSLAELLGPRMAAHTLLYWSTEPHDNPHYVDCMRDFEEITGYVVCTATARFDEKWIRDLIGYYRRVSLPWPRVSVLSKKIMQRLHKQFTPEEFRDVNLLMQQSDGEEFRTKVPGGRPKMMEQLKHAPDLRKLPDGEKLTEEVPQGSIACVSGLLINIIDRTIKLISPCYTTAQYPYGYRIFDEATFETAEQFDQVLRAMIERKTLTEPYAEMPLHFRDDLDYRPNDEGFVLVSPNNRHTFSGSPIWSPLGDLIARGDSTYEEACETMFDVHLCNPILAAGMIKNLFDRGFLDEVHADVSAAPVADSQRLVQLQAG